MAIGILMLLFYLALVVYTFKGENILMGFLMIAAVYTSLALIGNNFTVNTTFLEANKGNMPTSSVDVAARVEERVDYDAR